MAKSKKNKSKNRTMIPRTEEDFKNDINVLLVRSTKIIDQFHTMSRKRKYGDVGTEIKTKCFVGSMDILRTHVDKTLNLIVGVSDMPAIDIADYLKKLEETENQKEE